MFDQLVALLLTIASEFDADVLSPTEAVCALDRLGAAKRVLDGLVSQVAKRVADAGTAALNGERNSATLVARKLRMPVGEARSMLETARRLDDLPATADAMRRGALSAKEAQMIAEAAVHNPAAEEQLLEAADQGMVPLRDACVAARAEVEDPNERSGRQRSLRQHRQWVDADGMIAGRYRLAPEAGGAAFARAIENKVQQLFRAKRSGEEHESLEAYAADALVSLVVESTAAKPSKGVNAMMHVIVDHDALVRGNAWPGERCDIPGVGPVNANYARGLLGDAFLTVIVKKGKDIRTVAHLGRHIPAVVKTALVVTGRECIIEGCHLRGYLELDHIHDYAKGGPTALDNLEWGCPLHHDLKTRGWILGPANPKTGKRTLRQPPDGEP